MSLLVRIGFAAMLANLPVDRLVQDHDPGVAATAGAQAADEATAKPASENEPVAQTSPSDVPAAAAEKPTPAQPDPAPQGQAKPKASPPPKPNKRLAIIDLDQVDGDFPFQGEYLGRASAGYFVGLQVVARGAGSFDAVLLPGGLPGAGWDRVKRLLLAGQRQDSQVVLVGDGYRVEVTPDEALVQDGKGQLVARLPKIHRVSMNEGAAPPCGALVLFDGSTAKHFEGGKMTADGLLEVGALTKVAVGDFRLHLEFRTPYMPHASGQGRSNSGVYIQQRYEVQILDSFGLEGVENECGGLYRQRRADVNMCFPPLSWQTYDIHFTAARWDGDGNKIADARITVVHNGQVIHNDYHLVGKTGAGKPEEPTKRPILLQNHGNPVHFRNVWIQLLEPLECVPAPTFCRPLRRLFRCR